MRILFLNQFVPPDPSPTSRLLGEVADELRRQGHEVTELGNRADYRGRKTLLGSRALREMTALLQIFIRALFSKKFDVLVCLTSPPLLLTVARWITCIRRQTRLIHWPMDLYPDVAVAVGEIAENSTIHRLSSRLMHSAYRACDKVIALDEDMADRLAHHGIRIETQPPWPPSLDNSSEDLPLSAPETKRFTWLYSGNLGRAHEWSALLEAQQMIERKMIDATLVFQGGGIEMDQARKQADKLGLQKISWRPYAEEQHLLPTLCSASCLIATQAPATKGCLWPSKLALCSLLDLPILWVGPEDGSVWRWLSSQGHGCFRPDDHEGIARHIEKLTQTPLPQPASLPLIRERIKADRESGIQTVARHIISQETSPG